jgi:hypothetical protein
VLGNVQHDGDLLAMPGDELRALGSGSSDDLAEALLGFPASLHPARWRASRHTGD